MKRLLEYESERVLPEAIDNLLKKYEGFISEVCTEPDKLDCFMASMRREMICWFSDHETSEEAAC